MSLDADTRACAALVERADPLRFRAAMAAPVAARATLFAIYAMNVEVSRAPWVTQEPMIAEMRLQWWRDVADEIAAGGPVRRHEVATPLAAAIAPELRSDLGPVMDALVSARSWDIYRDPFDDADHFDRYLDATGAGLMWMAAHALGARDAAPVRAYGQAAALAAWFRAVPELEARGRVPLVDGRADAVAELARRGLGKLAAARAQRRAVPPVARAAFLPGWQAGALLAQAARDPRRVADGTLGQSGARANLSLGWQAATGRW
ncbi:MAG: squalene/phytoene synthase family protein [Marinibacterium sp.]|nr:squalene/phytoene synthase family protein [Marinibacterium sp.]